MQWFHNQVSLSLLDTVLIWKLTVARYTTISYAFYHWPPLLWPIYSQDVDHHGQNYLQTPGNKYNKRRIKDTCVRISPTAGILLLSCPHIASDSTVTGDSNCWKQFVAMQQFRGPYSSAIIAVLTCACKTFFLHNINAYCTTVILATALNVQSWAVFIWSCCEIRQSIEVY